MQIEPSRFLSRLFVFSIFPLSLTLSLFLSVFLSLLIFFYHQVNFIVMNYVMCCSISSIQLNLAFSSHFRCCPFCPHSYRVQLNGFPLLCDLTSISFSLSCPVTGPLASSSEEGLISLLSRVYGQLNFFPLLLFQR